MAPATRPPLDRGQRLADLPQRRHDAQGRAVTSRQSTTYRMKIEEARAWYVDPEPVPNSLEVREVSEQRGHGHVLGAKTKA